MANLADTVAELKTALAGAATSDEVAALQANLTTAQADLAELLAQSNIYSDDITVDSQSTLDFATALGDKVVIVDGSVTITQDNDMDAAQLATFMAKLTSVTGDVSYTATTSSTVTGEFTNLNGSKKLTIDQTGNISLPVYVQATGDFSLTGDNLSEEVSLPALTKAASLSFNDLSNVTTFDMSAMEEFDGDLTINIDNSGSVNLSSYSNGAKVDGTSQTTPDALTVNAATLTAPLYKAGVITANRLTSVDLPMWQYAHGSSFDRAQTVVLPSVNPGKATSFTINIDSVFDDATSVHFIAAANSATAATAASHVNVTSTSDALETLILGGTYTTINISGSDVTSITFDGTAHSVTVDNTDIEVLDMPYTSAAKGVFVVTNNSKMTTLHADKIDGLATFTLKDNSDLAEISFDALETSATTGALITISGNDLSVESYNAAQTAPVVAKSIVSADLAVVQDFVADAISKVSAANKLKSNVQVDVDDTDIVRYYGADGEETDVPAGTGEIVSYSYVAVASNAVPGKAQIQEMKIGGLATTNVLTVAGEAISILSGTGLDDYYDVKNWAESAATVSALSDAGLTIESVSKGARTATIDFSDITGTTLSNITGVVFQLTGLTGDVASYTGDDVSKGALAIALDALIDAGDGVVSKYYTVSNDSGKLTFTSKAEGTARYEFSNLGLSAYALSGTVEGTPITFGSASVVFDTNIEAVDKAIVRFTADAAGLDGSRTITLASATTATLLTVSGVDTDFEGDDEAVQAATDEITNTLDNSDAIEDASVDNMQYVSAS